MAKFTDVSKLSFQQLMDASELLATLLLVDIQRYGHNGFKLSLSRDWNRFMDKCSDVNIKTASDQLKDIGKFMQVNK